MTSPAVKRRRAPADAESYQWLWLAVVAQAQHDIETLPLGSVEYEQAVDFFTTDGEWALARQAIADAIGRSSDEMVAAGQRMIAQRLRQEADNAPLAADAAPLAEPPRFTPQSAAAYRRTVEIAPCRFVVPSRRHA